LIVETLIAGRRTQAGGYAPIFNETRINESLCVGANHLPRAEEKQLSACSKQAAQGGVIRNESSTQRHHPG
jgi:hypothetical protein